MISFQRNVQRVAGSLALALLVLAFIAVTPGCGDEFPTQTGDDVAAVGDVVNDLGTVGDAQNGDSVDPDGAKGDATLGDGTVADGTVADSATADVATDALDDAGSDASDATVGDAADSADGGDATPTCPGDPGCVCKEDKDCTAGACALKADGTKVCASPCTADADCGKAEACQDVSGVKVCVEAGASLCAPCVSNSACTYGDDDGVCVAGGSAGNFCGTSCTTTADCVSGYSCDDVKDVASKDAKQCVPENKAVCACSGYAIATAAKTTCFAAGLPGCTSTRQCLADGAAGAPTGGGLGACTTKAPEKETCDGIDNNCDGATDEDGAKGCDDGNGCTADTCEGGKGCVHNKLDATSCDDGSACTKGDTCQVGLCTGVTVSCDDSNPCTDEACDIAAGCTSTNNTKACDDGDACTKDDGCAVGLCAGATVVCDDSNPCTDDSCDLSAGCTTTNNTASCDDADACTKDDTCAASLCAGVTKDCDDANPCTVDSCDTKAGCDSKKLNTGSCDDGTACTTGDTCEAGVCNGKKLDCDDTNACTADACDPTSGCTNTNLTKACDDGDACSEKDACLGGKCVGEKKSCQDGNACTDDSCDTKTGCVFTQNTSPCDDGVPCSIKDLCAAGKCVGTPKLCDDSNACTADTCDKSTGDCAFKPLVGNTCTDGNACTEKDSCDKDGKCAGSKLNCEDGKPCTDDPCDVATGCGAKILTKKPCDDGSVCTSSDTCDGKGACVGAAVVCDDNNPCTDDSCDAKLGCQKKNNTATCTDGDACTDKDACAGGSCKAGANTCQCKNDGECAGKSKNLCNGALVCKANKCEVEPKNVVTCTDDKNVCTLDACTPATGKCDYTAVSDGTTCDADGTKCTAGDACAKGTCVAGKKLDCDDSKPCTADSCDKATGCVNTVLKSGGVTLLDFNAYPGDDGALGTKDDKPALKDEGVTTQYASLGLTFGLVGGGAPRIFVSNSLVKPYAPNVLRPVDPKDEVKAENYKDVWVNLSHPAMRVKIMVLDIHTDEASALKAYNAKGDLIGEAKHPGAPGGLIVPLEVKVDGSKGWIARVVVDLTNSAGGDAGPELYDNFEFEWVPGCSDGNFCTEPDTCDRTKGACLSGAVKNCDDGNQCTKDSCDATLGCKNVALDKAPCEDGNKCTDGDVCAKDKCVAGKAKGCDDGKPCTVDSCDAATGCVYKDLKDGDACTDGSACTTNDTCKTAKCIPGAALKCDDGDLCTLDSCSAKVGCVATAIAGCGVKPLPLPYFEPFGCTSISGKLWKLEGAQKSPAWAIDATPASPAAYSPKCSLNFNDGTNYVCKTGSTKLLGTATSPALDLTKAKLPVLTFQLGGDWEGGTYDDVQLEISTDGVNFTLLVNYNDAGSNAWSKKTVALTAYNGKVIHLRFRFYTVDCQFNAYTGAFVDDVKVEETACANNSACNDGNDCTIDVCTLATGKCLYSSAQNGSKCEDGDLCTVNICALGKCAVLSTTKCLDDSNACTQNNACDAKTGKCAPTYIENCDDANPCTTDACNIKTGGCSHATLKTCKPTCTAPEDCYDSNPCTVDVCGKDGFCAWTSAKAGTVCGDGKVCGKADQCGNLTQGWARNLTGDAYGYHFCVTTSTGGVACWGRNDYYQAGNGTTTSSQVNPRLVAGLTGIADVEAGRYHTCARTSIGEVWCWGRNNYGQSAPGLKATVMGTPQKVPGLLAVRKLALGEDYTCALHADRTVSCWGYNTYGQLGHGDTTAQLQVKKVAGLTGVMDLTADYRHTCAVRSDGGLYCTGYNSYSQSSEQSGNRLVFTKRPAVGPLKLISVMTGHQTTCAAAATGWGCLGNSTYGAMGNGSTATAVTPVLVNANKQPVAQMAGGYYVHYALTPTGAVYGAGRDNYGNFGLATTVTSRTSYVKTGYGPAADVAGVYDTSCVLTSAGLVQCAGYNYYGQLGNGGTTSSNKPVDVVAPCVTASTCDDSDSCTKDSCTAGLCVHAPLSGAVCSDGDACTVKDVCQAGKCVGAPADCDDKDACTIGDACKVDKGGLATCVPGKPTVCDDNDKCSADSCDKATGKCVFKPIAGCVQACKADLDCDDSNPCTLSQCLAGGCVKKSANEGMLCDEAKICTSGTCSASGKGWAAKISIETGGHHVCALGTDTKVYCWGNGSNYRTGQSSTANLTKPTAVPGITGATDVVAGYDHSCAKVAGKWLCWGSNTYGELGGGKTGSATSTPVLVTVVKDPVAITAGYRYTCALRQDGTVFCWGYQSAGRLGSGSTDYVAAPLGVQVKGLTGIVRLWSGYAHSCAANNQNEVFCWGSNSEKRIFDGTSPSTYYAPVKKASATAGVGGGYGTVCWAANDGTGWCTGDNDNGQLGDGSLTDSGKPVQVVGPKDIAMVLGGGNHTTALTATGALWTAGDNFDGQLGIGSTTDSGKFLPAAMPGKLAVVQVRSGYAFTCALLIDGKVVCTGDGYYGALGNSSTSDTSTFGLAAGPCTAASQCDDGDPCTADLCTAGSCAHGVAVGKAIPCNDGLGCTTNDVCSAGKCAGTAVSCDDKNACTLGDSCKEGKANTPVCVPGAAKDCNDLNPCTADSCDPVTGGCKSVAIKGCLIGCKNNAACDDSFPCTIDVCNTLSGGCVYTPGNEGAVCAEGSVCSNGKGAGKCVGITQGWAKAIESDSYGQHVCALRHDKTVACWGNNGDGQIGNDSKSTVRKPVVVAGLSNVKMLALGYSHTCALREDGALYCWGYNNYGQCGTGTASSTDLTKPTLAAKVPALSAVWAGYYTTCGLTQTGAIMCWGYGSGGERGDGTTTSTGATPVTVQGLPKAEIIAVDAQYRRWCALTSAGDLYCWGYNGTGDVNDSTTSYITKATKRGNVSSVSMIGGGSGTMCGMQPSKAHVVCWGDGGDGELGHGASPSSTITPQVVKGLTSQPVQIGGGDDHTLYLGANGKVYAAGDAYYYQLGDGSSTDKSTVVQATLFKGTYVAVRGAYNTTCALGADGEVYCVGYNYYGTVGSNSTSSTISSLQKVIKP